MLLEVLIEYLEDKLDLQQLYEKIAQESMSDVVDCITILYGDETNTKFVELVVLLTTLQDPSTFLERLPLQLLEDCQLIDQKQFNKKLKRIYTDTYFTFPNNLLQESIGFSKLITLLQKEFTPADVAHLIGLYSLDPLETSKIIYRHFEMNLILYPKYLKVINDLNISGTVTNPIAKAILERNEEHKLNTRVKFNFQIQGRFKKKVMVGDLQNSSVVEEKDDEQKETANKDVEFVCALLAIGNTKIYSQISPQMVEACWKIGFHVARQLEFQIDGLLKKNKLKKLEGTRGVTIDSLDRNQEYFFKNWNSELEPCNEIQFLPVLEEKLKFIGPYLYKNPIAMGKVLEILISMYNSFSTSQQESVKKLLLNHILPAAALSFSNEQVSMLLWKLIKQMPIKERYELYHNYPTIYSKYHIMSHCLKAVKQDLRYIMNRIASDTVNEHTRNIAKVLKSNPILCDGLIELCISKNNMIPLITKSLSFMGGLEIDCFVYSLLTQIMVNRPKIEGQVFQEWYKNLCKLITHTCSLHKDGLQVLIEYLAGGEVVDFLLVQEIISTVGQYPFTLDMTEQQIDDSVQIKHKTSSLGSILCGNLLKNLIINISQTLCTLIHRKCANYDDDNMELPTITWQYDLCLKTLLQVLGWAKQENVTYQGTFEELLALGIDPEIAYQIVPQNGSGFWGMSLEDIHSPRNLHHLLTKLNLEIQKFIDRKAELVSRLERKHRSEDEEQLAKTEVEIALKQKEIEVIQLKINNRNTEIKNKCVNVTPVSGLDSCLTFVQNCVIPRAKISPIDATYVFDYVTILHENGTILFILEILFSESLVYSLLAGLTITEIKNFGYFLMSLMKFAKSAKLLNAEGQTFSQHHQEQLIQQWNCQVQNACIGSFKGSYGQLINAMMLLDKLCLYLNVDYSLFEAAKEVAESGQGDVKLMAGSLAVKFEKSLKKLGKWVEPSVPQTPVLENESQGDVDMDLNEEIAPEVKVNDETDKDIENNDISSRLGYSGMAEDEIDENNDSEKIVADQRKDVDAESISAEVATEKSSPRNSDENESEGEIEEVEQNLQIDPVEILKQKLRESKQSKDSKKDVKKTPTENKGKELAPPESEIDDQPKSLIRENPPKNEDQRHTTVARKNQTKKDDKEIKRENRKEISRSRVEDRNRNKDRRDIRDSRDIRNREPDRNRNYDDRYNYNRGRGEYRSSDSRDSPRRSNARDYDDRRRGNSRDRRENRFDGKRPFEDRNTPEGKRPRRS